MLEAIRVDTATNMSSVLDLAIHAEQRNTPVTVYDLTAENEKFLEGFYNVHANRMGKWCSRNINS